jgi:hypothetical protein
VKLPTVGLAEAPGAIVPLKETVPNTEPLPPSMPADKTVTALPDARPDVAFINNEPPLTVVAPVYVLAAVNVSVPVPLLFNAKVLIELPLEITNPKVVLVD